MREAKHQTWVANPVMVKKSDGGWRMYVDFTDINKAYLKDCYPLPEIDWKPSAVSYRRVPKDPFLQGTQKLHKEEELTIDTRSRSSTSRNEEICGDSTNTYGTTTRGDSDNVPCSLDIEHKGNCPGMEKLILALANAARRREGGHKIDENEAKLRMETLYRWRCGNGYSLKDKNQAKTDKTEHGLEKREKSKATKSKSTKVDVKDGAETEEILNGPTHTYLWAGFKRNFREVPINQHEAQPEEMFLQRQRGPILRTPHYQVGDTSLPFKDPEGKEYTYAPTLQIQKNKQRNRIRSTIDWVANITGDGNYNPGNLRRITIAGKSNKRNQNKKANALSKLASMTFEHLTKEMLVEVLSKRSKEKKEIPQVETKEGESWMTHIHEYLVSGLLPKDPKESRKIKVKAPQYKLIRGNLYRRSFYTPWRCCVASPQIDDIVKEVHEGSCGFNVEPRSMVVRITKQGYYWPAMHQDATKTLSTNHWYVALAFFNPKGIQEAFKSES
nr:reverse transcriptase domain-containing protein [Tanacetum cinerariifolium]